MVKCYSEKMGIIHFFGIRISVYKSSDTEEYHFSGKRIHRGQYRAASGQVLNADVNGALNIMRKSSVVDVNILYSSRGEVNTQ